MKKRSIFIAGGLSAAAVLAGLYVGMTPRSRVIRSLDETRNTSPQSSQAIREQFREFLNAPESSSPIGEYSHGPFGIMSGIVDRDNIPRGQPPDGELYESMMKAGRRDWRGPYPPHVGFEPTLILPSTGTSLEERLKTAISKRTDATPIYLEALNGEKPNADNYRHFFTSMLDAHFTTSDNYKEILPLLSKHNNLLHIVLVFFVIDRSGTIYMGGIPNPLTNGVDDEVRKHYSNLLAKLPKKFVLPSVAGIDDHASFSLGIRNMAVKHTQQGRVDNFPYVNGVAITAVY